jgi:hypothetical protein
MGGGYAPTYMAPPAGSIPPAYVQMSQPPIYPGFSQPPAYIPPTGVPPPSYNYQYDSTLPT